MRVYFFGCWNQAGHHLHEPGGRSAYGLFGWSSQFDGGYAPRRHRRTGATCWRRQGATEQERQRCEYDSEEFPQGQFIRHQVDGFTIISWWDRAQGDVRGACNSTFLLEGEHGTPIMLAQLHVHFPHVVANLEKAGVELVEVVP